MRNLEGAQHAFRKQLMRRQTGNVLPVQKHVAGAGLVVTRNHVKQRGLAGAIRANQTGDPACFKRQRHVIDGMNTAKVHLEIFNFDHDSNKTNGPSGALGPSLHLRGKGSEDPST